MITTDKLNFRLVIEEPDTTARTVIVCPRYENLKIKWSKPQGKMYYAEELSGNVKFWGVDFVLVRDCALRTKFTLIVYSEATEVGRCYFRKTDCDWDINHGVCDVTVDTYDEYDKIEANKDNEYNLVDLNIEKNRLYFYQYPVRQVYAADSSDIYLFAHQEPYNAQVTAVEDAEQLSQSMHFGNYARLAIRLTSDTHGSFMGMTYATRTIITPGVRWTFNISMQGINGYSEQTIALSYNGTRLTGTLTIAGTTYSMTSVGGDFDTIRREATLAFTVGQNIYRFDSRITAVFSRLAVPVVVAGYELVEGDVYKGQMVSGLGLTQTDVYSNLPNIAISSNVSSTDTGYGKVEGTNYYYDKPDTTNEWWPLYKDSWADGLSLWVGTNWVTVLALRQYRKNVYISDFYTLGDAIKAVLNKIDSSIVFEADADHSQFLFGSSNPISGESQGTLHISQKSNILNLGYDYPAWQAPITWARIETLLNNAFNCYWDLYTDSNGDKNLRIEHYAFYANGGTYQPGVINTFNLNSKYNTANRMPYAFNTNRWQWDLDTQADRYEYGWMDTQSALFDGNAITIPEAYKLFTEDKSEERKVDWFSSDVDFLVSVPSECSSDGFVLVMEDYTNSPDEDGKRWVLIDNSNANSIYGYYLTNYQLALKYLQPRFCIQGMYSPKVLIGDDEVDNEMVARMRTAEVQFRIPKGETMIPHMSITTEAGVGMIETLEWDLASDGWTATIRYENE